MKKKLLTTTETEALETPTKRVKHKEWRLLGVKVYSTKKVIK